MALTIGFGRIDVGFVGIKINIAWKRLTTLMVAIALALGFGQECVNRMQVNITIAGPSNNPFVVQMTRKDAKRLESFFREVMVSDALAYTLAGAKPLSFVCYRPLGGSLRSFAPANIAITRGWPIWQRISSQLPTKRVRLWEEESPWVQGVRCLILADGELCDQCIEKNSADFRTILGVLPTSFLQETVEKPLLSVFLRKHDALLGMLLGFGRHNAWLYYDNTRTLQISKQLPRTWHAITEKESSHLAMKRCLLQTLDMTDLMLPVFVGDPDSEESQLLQKKYREIRSKLVQYYHGKPFLSATLSLYQHGASILESQALAKDSSLP